MNEQVKEYIDKYPAEIIGMYNSLRQMIFDRLLVKPVLSRLFNAMYDELPTAKK